MISMIEKIEALHNCVKSLREEFLEISFNEWFMDNEGKILTEAKHGYKEVTLYMPEYFFNFKKKNIEDHIKKCFQNLFDFRMENKFGSYAITIIFKD